MTLREFDDLKAIVDGLARAAALHLLARMCDPKQPKAGRVEAAAALAEEPDPLVLRLPPAIAARVWAFALTQD